MTRNLWRVVRSIMREQHGLLVQEFMRDSYYLVRDFLAAELGVSITQDEFNWFLTDQGYSTYRDDQWTRLEQREGLQRPRAKREGFIYNRGRQEPIGNLSMAWDQNRGWIFTEKSGVAERIQGLSEYGWGIATVGRGFPTRLVRRLLQDDARPVAIFHDADISGEAIYEVFESGSRRTAHLALILDDALDLGLRYEDAQALDLPSQPEPPKYGGAPRYEISALTVLRARWTLDEHPILQYAKARLDALGFLVAPTEVEREDLWDSEARFQVSSAVNAALAVHLDAALLEFTVDEGTAVYADTEGVDVELPELEDLIREAVRTLHESVSWTQEAELHDEAMREVDARFRDLLG